MPRKKVTDFIAIEPELIEEIGAEPRNGPGRPLSDESVETLRSRFDLKQYNLEWVREQWEALDGKARREMALDCVKTLHTIVRGIRAPKAGDRIQASKELLRLLGEIEKKEGERMELERVAAEGGGGGVGGDRLSDAEVARHLRNLSEEKRAELLAKVGEKRAEAPPMPQLRIASRGGEEGA